MGGSDMKSRIVGAIIAFIFVFAVVMVVTYMKASAADEPFEPNWALSIAGPLLFAAAIFFRRGTPRR